MLLPLICKIFGGAVIGIVACMYRADIGKCFTYKCDISLASYPVGIYDLPVIRGIYCRELLSVIGKGIAALACFRQGDILLRGKKLGAYLL